MFKPFFLLCLIVFFSQSLSQNIEFQTLSKDKISIRAIQISDEKVWYVGTDSKFGYVNLKKTEDKKQIKLSDQKLQFRTLAQDKENFYAINVESPAYFFKINKKSWESSIVFKDTLKTAFYDSLHKIDGKKNDFFYAVSDPDSELNFRVVAMIPQKNMYDFASFSNSNHQILKLNPGEAFFAASNSNIASKGKYVWFATGGKSSRIIRYSFEDFVYEIFDTPFIQGTSSQGMYSVDFLDENFGVAVGGDYTRQSENLNNIATTNDGGKTWQIRASGKNGGYKTCVKIRPKSKGKDMIAVGDQNIDFSSDYGKTWTTISQEKGIYICEWLDENMLVFAGKDRILKGVFRK